MSNKDTSFSEAPDTERPMWHQQQQRLQRTPHSFYVYYATTSFNDEPNTTLPLFLLHATLLRSTAQFCSTFNEVWSMSKQSCRRCQDNAVAPSRIAAVANHPRYSDIYTKHEAIDGSVEVSAFWTEGKSTAKPTCSKGTFEETSDGKEKEMESRTVPLKLKARPLTV